MQPGPAGSSGIDVAVVAQPGYAAAGGRDPDELQELDGPLAGLVAVHPLVELDGLAGEPMDVLVNGCLIAQGEVVVVNEKCFKSNKFT